MGEIKKLNYTNSLVVASELVKFLATNSDFDSVKSLQQENNALKSQLAQAIKDLVSITKSVATLGNKVDDCKSQITNIQKRIKTLEEKKNNSS
mmetsp:Transcript_17771/g.25098  ORF Transcript_17771/g.25098 Transcript_17771/m.25098 type:complete len:93 (-) Transcript_17771:288-566(-)